MSVVEHTVVGRKTPGDGKLEISDAFARALGGAGTPLDVHIAGQRKPASVIDLACTCAKAALHDSHFHHFVECVAFRELPVGAPLELRGDVGRLDVVRGGHDTTRVTSSKLPGSELIDEGLADLKTGNFTVAALLVSIGAPRLQMLGYQVPNAIPEPEHALYALLAREHEDSAHGRYNALVRRLVSFERAAACAR